MNFSEQIMEVFDYIGDKMGIAVDWTNANVLHYIEQLCAKYIKWEIATSVIWIILSVIFIITSLTLGVKTAEKAYKEDNFGGGMLYVIVYGIAISFFICIFVQIFDIAKCVCFPEMQIYEYVSSLMQPNN